MDCLFCKIIKGEIPSKKIYEDDKVIVILDAYPIVDGHCLVIPKKHYTDIMELDEETILYMHKIAKDMTKLLMEKLNAPSMTLSVNYGDHQKVKHVHLHLLTNFPKKNTQSIEIIYEKIKNPN